MRSQSGFEWDRHLAKPTDSLLQNKTAWIKALQIAIGFRGFKRNPKQKPKTKIPSQEPWQETLGSNGVNHKESPRGEATIEKLRLINTPPCKIYVRGLTSLGGLNFPKHNTPQQGYTKHPTTPHTKTPHNTTHQPTIQHTTTQDTTYHTTPTRGHSCWTLLLGTLSWHSFFYTLSWHSCLALLLNTLAGHSWHSCWTLLTGHCRLTLCWTLFARHSCWTPLTGHSC